MNTPTPPRILIALACALLLPLGKTIAQTNLVTINPSFEAVPNVYFGSPGTYSSIPGWQVIGNASTSAIAVGVSPDQPNVTGRDGNIISYIWNGSFETAAAERPAITAGALYLLRVRKESDTSGNVNFSFGVNWYNSTSGYVPLANSVETESAANLTAFQPLSRYVTAPAGATHAGVYIATGTGGGVLVDQVELFLQPFPPPGTPPVLPTQSDVNTPYGIPLSTVNTVIYQGLPRVKLTYSLVSPPDGATIDADGVFSWTPSYAQSGVTHTITIRVADNADPLLADQRSFMVTVVAPPNVAPVLPKALRRTVVLGSTLRVANAGTDANIPAQTLTYELINPPAGASITAGGQVNFTPLTTGTPTITVRATDNGIPALSTDSSYVVDVLPPSPAGATNLLATNPGFETTGDGFSFYHGAYTMPGWSGYNNLYNAHYLTYGSVADGNTTEGFRAYHMDWDGMLTTSAANRAVAIPGMRYELLFDLRTLVGNFPGDLLGTFAYIEFFDASGNLIKSVWGPDWRPQSQADGVAPWETIVIRGIAPAGAASVGVRVHAPGGIYYSNEYNRTENRHVELDNFRLYQAPENLDRIALRRLPRLVEPGASTTLRVSTAATAPRTLVARLVDGVGTVRTEASLTVPAGRGLRSLDVSIPGGLPNGTYSWELGLVPVGGVWSEALGLIIQTGVLVDQSVSAPTLNATDFRADDSRILYMGRIEELPNGSRWWHWFGSEVRLRFSGTSLSLIGVSSDNGFGGFNDSHKINVVVDGDTANLSTLTLPQNGDPFTLPLVAGLSDGIHTVTIFKAQESDLRIRFDAFRVDAGRGLLRPEPLPNRRVEIFGDSVTSGSEASPNFFGYASLLARELDADIHIVSKGGSGVGASFGSLSSLWNSTADGGYWNNLSHPDVNNEGLGVAWDFSRWTPNVVLVAIGHNDQFNDGGPIFASRYNSFRDALRTSYPNTPVISINTTISNPVAHFQAAIAPLIAADPLWTMAFQLNPSEALVSGHPDRAGHAAMAYGDAKRFSVSDVAEDRAGWGLDRPLTGYEQWAAANFTPSQIALGLQGPLNDLGGQGVNNLLRYALGLTPGAAVSSASLTTVTTDNQQRLTLTFMRARSDVSYLVEASSDLVSWQIISTNPGVLGQMVTAVDTIPVGSRRFMRLRIVSASQ